MARFPVSGNGLASETEPAKLSASELPASVVTVGSGPTTPTVGQFPKAASGPTVKWQPAPYSDPYDYGYDPVASDNTAAVNAAITALPTGGSPSRAGGVVMIPNGFVKCAGQINAAASYGVRLQGQGGKGYIGLGSILQFTGSGSGSFIDARSSQGFKIDKAVIEYTNAGYSGNLIDFQHSTGADASNAVLSDCTISGRGVYGAKSLVSLQLAILCELVNCKLSNAQAGVRLREDNGIGGTQYSNAHNIKSCQFDNTLAAIVNAGQVLNVEGCWFEGTNGGNAMQRAYYDDITVANSICYGLRFVGCWFGDATAVTTWIEFGTNVSPGGLEIAGCLLSGGALGVKFNKGGGGFQIAGNAFGGTSGIDLGSSGVGLCYGVNITGNDFSGCTGQPVLNASGHHNLNIVGNGPRNGGVPTADIITPVVSSQQSGTTYTFALSDSNTVVESTAASAAAFTVPPNASVAFPIGTVIELFQDGAGQVTITAGVGVTLRSDAAKVKTAAQYATVGLRKRDVDEWVLTGDLA